jgi:hypothetical protein
MSLERAQMMRHSLADVHALTSDLRSSTDEITYRFCRIFSSAAKACSVTLAEVHAALVVWLTMLFSALVCGKILHHV